MRDMTETDNAIAEAGADPAATGAIHPEALAWLEQAKDFSQDKRDELAKKGYALPDGSFPIEDTGDLRNALHALGRAKDIAKAKAHIKKRAAALKATDMLPDTWR